MNQLYSCGRTCTNLWLGRTVRGPFWVLIYIANSPRGVLREESSGESPFLRWCIEGMDVPLLWSVHWCFIGVASRLLQCGESTCPWDEVGVILRFIGMVLIHRLVGDILRVAGMVPYKQAPNPNSGSYGKLTGIREMYVISSATFTATLQCSNNHVPVRARPRCEATYRAREYNRRTLAPLSFLRLQKAICASLQIESEAPYLSAVNGKKKHVVKAEQLYLHFFHVAPL